TMANERALRNIREFDGELVRPRWFYRQWMLAGNPARFFKRLAEDCGDFIHYRGLFSFYQVNHPALVKQVLMQTHKHFDKRNIIYGRFGNVFGDGLVISEGDKWKRQRKLMQPMFGPVTVQRFFDSMVNATHEAICRWKTDYRDQQVFDMATEMDQLTLRIAGEALFSEGFEKDSQRISHWNETINFYCAKPPLPIIRSFWFPSSVNRKLKQTLREFHSFIGELIENRRTIGPKNDLLSILLEATHDDSGKALTDHEIKEEILGMILGGHETSSSALAWIWYELDRHPEVQQKLHVEIRQILGDEPISIEAFANLKYTRMVIDECLRLHPPFWFENRNTMEDVELGGHMVPKGSIVLFSRHALHRHPDFWQNPRQFDPERQHPDHPEHQRTDYAQVPFGGGPRFCLGFNFAIMELVVIVATVFQKLHVKVAPDNRHAMSAKMTMFPKHGVKVSVSSR
ncbi:MAG: cytochrome P450, partial [Planctomycetota bacterium]